MQQPKSSDRVASSSSKERDFLKPMRGSALIALRKSITTQYKRVSLEGKELSKAFLES